jgi:hypothetical protein
MQKREKNERAVEAAGATVGRGGTASGQCSRGVVQEGKGKGGEAYNVLNAPEEEAFSREL